MTRRTRTFEEVSDADILDQIATEHSLTADLSLEGPTYRLVAQVNQSDLAFIRERARVVGAEVWVAGSTLFARSRTGRAGEPVELAYGANLLSFQVRADLAHQCTEVSVTGWDVAAKAGIDETGGEGSIANELNGDTSGSSVLADAFSERTERLVHAVPLTSDQARSVAEAHYRARARRFLTGNGLCDGNGRVRVGTTVTLSGLGSLFDGDYAVVRTRHTYDLASGFRSEFDVERPGLGPAAA